MSICPWDSRMWCSERRVLEIWICRKSEGPVLCWAGRGWALLLVHLVLVIAVNVSVPRILTSHCAGHEHNEQANKLKRVWLCTHRKATKCSCSCKALSPHSFLRDSIPLPPPFALERYICALEMRRWAYDGWMDAACLGFSPPFPLGHSVCWQRAPSQKMVSFANSTANRQLLSLHISPKKSRLNLVFIWHISL